MKYNVPNYSMSNYNRPAVVEKPPAPPSLPYNPNLSPATNLVARSMKLPSDQKIK